jgi:hypothetical protein
MNEVRRNDYLLPIDDTGVPPLDRLAALTVGEWMKWLRFRSEEVDVFTGERLDGSADPYQVVRNSIIRADDKAISGRFIEAAFQLVGELTYALTVADGGQNTGVAERRTHLLAGLLELLSSLPDRILSLEKNLTQWIESVHFLLMRTLHHPLSETASPSLLQAALGFLENVSYPIPRSDLEKLLKNPATSVKALFRLLKDGDREGAKYFKLFVSTCIENNNKVLLDMVIDSMPSRLGDDQVRRLIFSASRLNGMGLWEQLNKLSSVKEIMSYSPTLEVYRSTKVMYYTDNRYLEGTHTNGTRPNEPSPYTNDLLEAILTKAKEEVPGGDLIPRPSSAVETWDQQAEDVLEGVVALDPIFLSHKRSRLLSLVPYGYVDELSVVYIDRNPEQSTKRAITLRSWRNKDLSAVIPSEYSSDDNIGCVGGTSATDELIHFSQQMGRALKPHSEIYLDSLLTFLFENLDTRILIVDQGFFPRLEQEFSQRTRPLNVPRGARLINLPLRYRRPVLAGVPFPKEDIYWGQILRDAVDKILYEKFKIHEGSELADKMKYVGIKPMTPEVFQKITPWIDVDPICYPTYVQNEAEQEILRRRRQN